MMRIFEIEHEEHGKKEGPVPKIDTVETMLEKCFCRLGCPWFVECGVPHDEAADDKKDIDTREAPL